MRVRRVGGLVIHCVVNVSALVVEELGEGHHCCVLEVFPKTASHQVHVDPLDVLTGECRLVEELGVMFDDGDKVGLLLKDPLFLLERGRFHPRILEQVHFFFIPKGHIVDITG